MGQAHIAQRRVEKVGRSPVRGGGKNINGVVDGSQTRKEADSGLEIAYQSKEAPKNTRRKIEMGFI